MLDESAEVLEMELFHHYKSEAAVDASVNHHIEGCAELASSSEHRIEEQLAVDMVER